MNINQLIELKLTHSIHNSETMSFRGCRRRWNWIFRDGWYPTTTAKPLEFGTAYHAAMEQWYNPEDWGKDSESREALAILTFVNECNKQKAAYLRSISALEADAEVEADYRERVELGTGMIRYHCRNVSPKVDVGFKPIRVEIEFEVPVTGPNGETLWCKCNHCWSRYYKHMISFGQPWWQYHHQDDGWANVKGEQERRSAWKGLPVTFGGRIDMLAEDEFGGLWIFDWKTAARLSGQEDGDTSDEFTQLEDQITRYLWALWVLGFKVAGFVHHEMKKAFPVEPEPNKTQRKGCWYSVNKQQNTSYDIYHETISENDPTGLASGAYDPFLDWLASEGPRYYSRKQVGRNEAELRNAGKNIWLEAQEMTRSDLSIYPSPGRFACDFCAFRQPCIGSNRDEDVEYMFLSNFDKRSPRYWEHNQLSTETKGGR